jgi:hypothetical protein
MRAIWALVVVGLCGCGAKVREAKDRDAIERMERDNREAQERLDQAREKEKAEAAKETPQSR